MNPSQLIISTKYEGICDEVITVYVTLMFGSECHITPGLLLPFRTMAKKRHYDCPLPTGKIQQPRRTLRLFKKHAGILRFNAATKIWKTVNKIVQRDNALLSGEMTIDIYI